MSNNAPPNSEHLFRRIQRTASFDDPYRGRKKIENLHHQQQQQQNSDTNLDQNEAIQPVESFCGPSRFQAHDPIIQTLFKKHGDQHLYFSAELNKVNKYMKFQKRILIITDQYVYNMHPKTFQVKREISIDRITKVHLSELRDDFLFIHVDNEHDYLYNTDRKTEIIQVLKCVKREKIPAHMRVSSWYSEGELEIMVGNQFEYAPERFDQKIPVEFMYDETLLNKEQVIDATKDKLTIRLMKEGNRRFAMESITMELKEYGFGGGGMGSNSPTRNSFSGNYNMPTTNTTNGAPVQCKCDRCFEEENAAVFCNTCKELMCELHGRAHMKDKHYREHSMITAEQYMTQLQETVAENSANVPSSPTTNSMLGGSGASGASGGEIKYIDVTDDPGLINVASSKGEYQLVVRFRAYRNLEDVKIVQTVKATTNKQQVTPVGNIQLFSSGSYRERFKRMEVRLDPLPITTSLSGNVQVSVQVLDKNKSLPLFKTKFSYSSSSKKRFSIWK